MLNHVALVTCDVLQHVTEIHPTIKKVLRETQTLRALAVVRFGHRPPQTNTQTDRTDYNTLPLASAQCNNIRGL